MFLNTLTGDSFYLHYYQDDYKKFKPKLKAVVQKALAELKRKIKNENQGIIFALLCLYFSATEDETLDDMLNTLENSQTMQNNLRQTPYYNENSWQLYESVRNELKTIFLFLKEIQLESYWHHHILPKIIMKIRLTEKYLPKYNVIKKESEYNRQRELFRDFVIRMIRNDKLTAGKIKAIYDNFYLKN